LTDALDPKRKQRAQDEFEFASGTFLSCESDLGVRTLPNLKFKKERMIRHEEWWPRRFGRHRQDLKQIAISECCLRWNWSEQYPTDRRYRSSGEQFGNDFGSEGIYVVWL
jgi:hypothetical protein